MDHCECIHHATRNLGIVILTGHHETCERRPDLFDASAELIRALVRGIEEWASQEDGIPDDLWETYAKAKAVIGETVNSNPEA